ncbi:type II toxin-antitoxin system RelE/ParE family toxin [Methylobacterium sp. E-066]|uniref:type II toxin-antitoxin system RelE/ParE family toxin n=1 Tax=Methylobacterium sp. E-066 TaxID=2836584 RepID=UPI001FB8EA2B|nr:type II toxin-antitoxin system RelE/ParE family toxin [Methylobacterium sp. E-066]MCJ2141213.1 type II toxin-antitoxin system RelE/ParE family toxin [Methylobacterium sp. E-066]
MGSSTKPPRGTASGIADAPPEAWSVSFLDETVVAEVDVWPVKLRAALDRIVARIETRGLLSLTEEHAKHIRGRIWELRPRTDGMTGRALYVTVTGKRVIIVLCAIKKTQTTPKRWIDLAETRARTIDTGETT